MTKSEKRPNILLIHSDQHRYDCVRAHGLRHGLKTPNLDRLCAEGVTFNRAYSTIPICTPARASLMTGTWPTTHGSFCIPTSEINRAARPELPNLFDLLKDAGYRTGWVGKYHGETETYPAEMSSVDAFHPVWEYREYRKNKGIPPLQKTRGLFGQPDTECPPEESPLAWQADRVLDLLKEKEEAPFFLRWDPPEPHLPCNPSQPYADLYDPADIPPWQSWPESLENKPGILKRQRRIWGLNGWSWEDWQPVVRDYYAVITEMDHQIGRLLDYLDENGLENNTLVLYSTDHGDFCGGHGLIDKHFCMYDDIAKVPLILRWPGQAPGGETCDAYASGAIDLARTIVESAGIGKPDTFEGENLVKMATDPDFRPRDAAYVQYFGTESGAYSCRMIREGHLKFVYHPVGERHEFYDLGEDPGELFNRIDDPTEAENIERLKDRLWHLMKENGDRLASRWTATELCGEPDYATAAGLHPNQKKKD